MVLAADDELEEVVAENLKDHADVRSVDAADLKVVEKLDRLLAFRIRFIALADAAQQLDLVQSRLCVVRGALDHLEGHKSLRSVIRNVEGERRKRKKKREKKESGES